MSINWANLQERGVDPRAAYLSKKINNILFGITKGDNILIDGLAIEKVNDNVIKVYPGSCIVDKTLIRFTDEIVINLTTDIETSFNINTSYMLVVKYKYTIQEPAPFATIDTVIPDNFDNETMLHIGFVRKDGSILKLSNTIEVNEFERYSTITKSFLNKYIGIEENSREIFISNTGDDQNGNGTSSNPYATIQRAINDIKLIIDMGVTITLRVIDGSYNVDSSAIVLNRFMGSGNIELRCNGTVPTSAGISQPVVLSFNSSIQTPIQLYGVKCNFIMQGIRVISANNQNVSKAVIRCVDSSDIVLRYNSFHSAGSTNNESACIQSYNSRIYSFRNRVSGNVGAAVQCSINGQIHCRDISRDTGQSNTRYTFWADTGAKITYNGSTYNGSTSMAYLGDGASIFSDSTEIVGTSGKVFKDVNNNDLLKIESNLLTASKHLVLPTGPGATNAVRKDYVDSQVGTKVSKAGDTMTGHLTLPANPGPANAVRKDYIETHTNSNSAHGATTDATPSRIILRDGAGRARIADPIQDNQIASKRYVDNKVNEIDLGLTYYSGSASIRVDRNRYYYTQTMNINPPNNSNIIYDGGNRYIFISDDSWGYRYFYASRISFPTSIIPRYTSYIQKLDVGIKFTCSSGYSFTFPISITNLSSSDSIVNQSTSYPRKYYGFWLNGGGTHDIIYHTLSTMTSFTNVVNGVPNLYGMSMYAFSIRNTTPPTFTGEYGWWAWQSGAIGPNGSIGRNAWLVLYYLSGNWEYEIYACVPAASVPTTDSISYQIVHASPMLHHLARLSPQYQPTTAGSEIEVYKSIWY